MKKYFLLMVATIFLKGSFAQKTLVNDNNAVARTLTASFNSITVSGGIDLYLSQYETESIAVSASATEYIQNIKTVVDNNTLRIYYNGGNGWNSGNKKIKVYVSFKAFEKLTASGASDVKVNGIIKVPSLKINMSGASSFKGVMEVNELNLDLTGASDAIISGSAEVVYIQSSGASDVKCYDLVTQVCTAKASGASDINITVNKELNVSASGASDIHYKGDAVIKNMNSSGASSISKKG